MIAERISYKHLVGLWKVMWKSNMFNIGDKVVSKKTGYPGIGEVCGIGTAQLVIWATKKTYHYWDRVYPTWKEKPVYTIRYSEPRFVTTCEEFWDGQTPQECPVLQAAMLDSRQISNIINYPEDDLEKYE